MDNSLVTHLRAYVEAIFLDVKYTYIRPSEWKRDQTRLLHDLEIKGVELLTLYLPALANRFDKWLDQGFVTRDGVPYGALVSEKCYVPKFLRDLHLQIFDNEGKLRDSPSVEAIVAIRQLLRGCKKMQLPCKQWRITDAIKDYVRIEQEARKPTLSWESDELDIHSHNLGFHDGILDHDGVDLFPGTLVPDSNRINCDVRFRNEVLDILHKVCDRISAQFGDMHIEDVHGSELPKHGPGAVANLESEVSKYTFPHWSAKLSAIFPYDLYARTDFGQGSDRDRESDGPLNYEMPSRLICVPKTQKGPRLIAAEPVEHQWIQQLILHQLENRLPRTSLASCVRIRTQEPNRTLASIGSLDGGYATVDLSSASDRLSCWAVERAFRRNWTLLERLHASRTRWVSNRIRTYLGSEMIIKKFAPMGSACTFPVQSVIYGCVAIAATIYTDSNTSSHRRSLVTTRTMDKAARRVQVYGDDIIVPKPALDVLVELLTFLGLRVNRDKTFGGNNFRESCGMDAFRGHDVTPVHLLTCPTNVRTSNYSSLIEVSNNFHQKGFWNVAKWLSSFTPRSKLMIFPVGLGVPGLSSFCGWKTDHLKSRWNDSLHRMENLALIPRGKVAKSPEPGTCRLFRWFIENPRPDTKWVSGVPSRIASNWKLGWYHSSECAGMRLSEWER